MIRRPSRSTQSRSSAASDVYKRQYGEYVDCRNAGIFKYSYYEVRYSLRATIKSLGMLIQGKATKDDISGPIGVAQVIGEVKEQAEPYGLTLIHI